MTKTAPELASPIQHCALNQREDVWPLGMIMCNRFHTRGKASKDSGLDSASLRPRSRDHATMPPRPFNL
ncbi:hypothetical protein AVEN_186758-1, partial [Araneus ventricosus]